MVWIPDTHLPDSVLDVDKPFGFIRWRQYRDRDNHNFEHALRGGTFASPYRWAYVGGINPFSITLAGGAPFNGGTTVSIFYGGDDPNFPGTPDRFDLRFEEDTTSGGIDWATNRVIVTGVIVNKSTVPAGFQVHIAAWRRAGSGTAVDGFIHWSVRGNPTAGE
jgi:hypothetical protein